MAPRTAQIGECTWWTDGERRSELRLPDGRVIPSVPHDTPDYEARAREMGYPDGAAMSREHDAIHAAIASVLGVVSPVLLDVASGVVQDRGAEEDLVKLVSLRLNAPHLDGEPGGGFVVVLRRVLREP